MKPLAAVTAVLLSAALAACVTPPVYTGTVKAVGSDPHVQLALVTDDVVYEIVGELKQELWQQQQQQVSVLGHIVREAAGPGLYAQLAVERILP